MIDLFLEECDIDRQNRHDIGRMGRKGKRASRAFLSCRSNGNRSRSWPRFSIMTPTYWSSKI
jgi:hypothetical protein